MGGIATPEVIGLGMALIKYGLIGIIFIAILAASLYYLLVMKKRKKYYLWIMEKKAGNTYHLTSIDTLIRKTMNFGKEAYYVLDVAKVEAAPPPQEYVYRLGNKERAFYMKLDDRSYVPLKPEIMGDVIRFTPMDYDVNVLLIHAMERREKIYKLKKDLWAILFPIIAILLVVVLIIVVVYLTYKFMGTIGTQYTSEMAQTNKKLDTLIERIMSI